MLSKDKDSKNTSLGWAFGKLLIIVLVVNFVPFFGGELGWLDKQSSIVVADDEGGENKDCGIPCHTPPNAQADVKPQSMIVMSNDHQLFFKAYTDWSDIDGDGEIDNTFDPEIKYYGYFDINSCYKYNENVEGGVFERNDSAKDDFSCPGNGEWSGNLLNWATMTRMDILRKVLYGGKRYRDNDDESVILERAFLPHDAHSFSKIISDSNIIKSYTPFKANTGSNGVGRAVTFCNTTYHAGDDESQEVTDPPLLRVAKGSWPNWAANEQWQCVWRGEGRSESSYLPYHSDAVGEQDYHVRVEVCAGGDNINCKDYIDSEYDKPIGLLHDYAEDIDFGLISGSYKNNKSGGVLRSNIKNFSEEFDDETGVFTTKSEDDRIVGNIDAFRIARYSYNNGRYNNSDNCPWGEASFNEGNCSNWGNPFAEMTLEALRYLSGANSFASAYGKGITQSGSEGEDESDINYVETDYVNGLTSPVWDNEVGESWCAAHSMILINSSESSFDSDDLDSWSRASFSQIKAATDAAGASEGLSEDYFFGVGENNADELCTAKELNGLSEAQGICPGAPRLEGSYYVAGLSKFAHENSVVKNPENPSEGSSVDTFAVRLSANLPLIEVLGENNEIAATLVPACENTGVTGGARCAIVDFRQDKDDPRKFQIVWEDSEFGGDYDSDLRMELSYDYDSSTRHLAVTTDVLFASTSKDDGQMGVGYVISGGSQRYKSAEYEAVVDNDSDGFIAHSGIYNYKSSLCAERANGCQESDGPSSQFYKVGGSTSGSPLPPPLYFAGKYGNDDAVQSYFEVGDISLLASSLQDVLGEVLNSANRTGAGLGASANVEGFVFQTLYNNRNSWSGDLVALKTAPSGIGEEAWSAREMMPPSDQRTIITYWNGFGVAFKDYGFNAWAELVPYLRGDASQEQRNGGDYRDRLWSDGSVASLGDIIDSKPFVIGKPDSYVLGSSDNTSYQSFVDTYSDRTPMVYVGANDGMLHGFDAETGVEKLAYVPGLLLDSIGELAGSDYQHRFYVDGDPTVLDARFGEGWHSVLASGLGAGGRGIFALNVTDPSEFSEANAEQIALFEYGPFNDHALFGEDDEDSHLGYIYGPPSIVQMENNEYAVVFGNGYASESGKAALYIIYLDGAADGSIESKDVILLVPGGSANDGGNGLSTVSLIDRNRNGRMDTAYAGDLQGNLWRFDLSDESDDNWQISHLFKATGGDANQVITTGVEVGRHPERGIMLFFGTGGAPGRRIPTSEERGAIDAFYAVCDVLSNDPDSLDWNCLDLNQANLPLTRNDLAPLQRRDSQSNTVVLGSRTDVGTRKGWYISFPADERVIDTPLLHGDHIIFTTLIPGRGFCGAEDSGFLYELSAFDGRALDSPALDVNGDGVVNEEDTVDGGDSNIVPIGIATQGAIFTPVIDTNLKENTENRLSVNTGAKTQSYQGTPLNPLRIGRVSWRELVN